jgi:uncharacterized phiE125 gp8 family phage protein
MPLQQLTQPTLEPVSLAEAKTHLRVIDTAEDTLITGLISGARQMAEQKMQRQILASRWKQVLDSFPGPSLLGVPWGRVLGMPPQAIQIERAAVLQVVSITYLDMSGVLQTLPASDYTVDLTSHPVRITPVFGKIWPANTLPQIGAVTVTFDCGEAARLTVDAAADTIYVPGWKTLSVGDTVRLSRRDRSGVGDSSMPAPLAESTDYYVQAVPAANTYKLAATSGGAALDLTSAGAGDLFIGEIPAAIRAWMLLAIGTLYENRESVAIDQRLVMAQLPTEFFDGLLDAYRLVLA